MVWTQNDLNVLWNDCILGFGREIYWAHCHTDGVTYYQSWNPTHGPGTENSTNLCFHFWVFFSGNLSVSENGIYSRNGYFNKKLWWTRGYGGTLFSDKPICIQWLTRKSWSFRAATKINSAGYITLHSLKSLTILDELPLTIPILPGLGRDVKEAGRPSWQLHR